MGQQILGPDYDGLVIENNTLIDIWGNGINIKERHASVQIIGNTITTSGIDLVPDAPGARRSR